MTTHYFKLAPHGDPVVFFDATDPVSIQTAWSQIWAAHDCCRDRKRKIIVSHPVELPGPWQAAWPVGLPSRAPVAR